MFCLNYFLPINIILLFFCPKFCVPSMDVDDHGQALISYDVHLLLADTAAMLNFEEKKFHLNEKELGKVENGEKGKINAHAPGSSSQLKEAMAEAFVRMHVQSDHWETMFSVRIQQQHGKCHFFVMSAEYLSKFDETLRSFMHAHLGVVETSFGRENKAICSSEAEAKIIALIKLLSICGEFIKQIAEKKLEKKWAIKNLLNGNDQYDYRVLSQMLEKYLLDLYDIEANKAKGLLCGLVDCLWPKENGLTKIIEHSMVDFMKMAKQYGFGHGEDLMEKLNKQQNLEISSSWALYCAKFGRKFANLEEVRERFNILQGTKAMILEHNLKENSSFKMGLNKFADWKIDELRRLNGMDIKKHMEKMRKTEKQKQPKFRKSSHLFIRETVDWREAGIVTEVKDQGHCGSCGAFSAIATLESHVALKSTKRRGDHIWTLSEQQCLDCSHKYDDEDAVGGCYDGVWPEYCYDYYMDFENRYGVKHGVQSDKDYPYLAKDDPVCHYNATKAVALVQDWNIVMRDWDNVTSPFTDPPFDEEAIKQAVDTIGPMSACIDVNRSWSLYESGVFYDPNCSDYDSPNYLGGHCIEIVGYGTDDETGAEYWLVKNSWTNGWGEKGYIRMARNRDHNCNIGSYVVYPIVSHVVD